MRSFLLVAALVAAATWCAPTRVGAQFRCATATGVEVAAAPMTGARCRRVGPGEPLLTVPGRGVRSSARGEQVWLPMVTRVAAAHGLPVALVAAVVRVESGWNPLARSRVGALGLMQLMPATAAALGVENPLDPEQNVDGGCRYLKELLAEFPLEHALAAYNAGPGAVRRYRGIPPYTETERYVPRVMARMAEYGRLSLSYSDTGASRCFLQRLPARGLGV